MKIPGRTLSAAAAVLIAAPVLAEDITVVFETTSLGRAGTSIQYLSSEKMRRHDGERDTIVEFASGKIVKIDHEKKEYSEITLAEIQESMKAMNAQMESLPPAMREKMAEMMGGMGGEVTVATGDTREIAGYSTQEYIVTMGEETRMSFWNTTDLEVPVPVAELRKLASFTGPMAMMADNPMFKGFGQLAEKIQEIEGFTLAETISVRMIGRGVDTSREATEVKTGPIPASEFDVAVIAKGYKKVKSPFAELGKR
jgi:hypothetical protein